MPRKFLHNNNRLLTNEQKSAEFPRNIILKRNIDYLSPAANANKAQGGFSSGPASSGIDLYAAIQNAIDNDWISIPAPATSSTIYNADGVITENRSVFLEPNRRLSFVSPPDDPFAFNAQSLIDFRFNSNVSGAIYQSAIYLTVTNQFPEPTLILGINNGGDPVINGGSKEVRFPSGILASRISSFDTLVVANSAFDFNISDEPFPGIKADFNDKRATKLGLQYIGFGEDGSGNGGNYSDLVANSLVPKAYVDANAGGTSIADGNVGNDIVAWETGAGEYVPKNFTFSGDGQLSTTANSIVLVNRAKRLRTTDTFDTDTVFTVEHESFVGSAPVIGRSTSSVFTITATNNTEINGIMIKARPVTVSSPVFLIQITEPNPRYYTAHVLDGTGNIMNTQTVNVSNNGTSCNVNITGLFNNGTTDTYTVLIKPVA